ncbi:glyoxalase/bleomycin resistance/dioxygenase family protein [Acuticoccus sediminis]|uniref:Glyoxalase/bleomycin resistance/dioxygenase family protein n=1 Tax=Acuticoccus sediminis TaxID=2184697 RepID=A0A8B2NDF9_9HYPH|nr:ArsI/CadI family heavy metal resistance metalloenzyme [Acuticoccus sediminis]RAH96515.1 glyoxalase/bleomycin resistance/dioxygenase family protein [Acuticoccus sediminis]
MKRLHVHVSVTDLDPSIRFYSTLFAAEPTVVKSDYAKWMLDDPRVNFAISARGREGGVEHLGIQVETRAELADVYARLEEAGRPVLEEGETVCCYARSEKAWVADPQGVSWETFLTSGESVDYGDSVDLGPIRHPADAADPAGPRSGGCCGPAPAVPEPACCGPAREAACCGTGAAS